ncbi:MAG TPA: ParB/RepB/Spo0J family partition protein [Firmicutes bacterium]|nr:ParB/RepB/Spo0J family partition protein [Bacillota bacterium]HHY99126.1 ParB/RepB/Spo0J family partition protein [Bacillota bacterium]
MVKKGLGKGLRALIPDETNVMKEQVTEISIDLIQPNPYQPRRQFDEDKLEELVESIRQHGVLQPLVVRPLEGGYQLIVGERRWRAARRAGLSMVPVVIRDVDEIEMMELALIENLQREDLTPIEEAQAFHRLINEFGLTQEELAEVVGRSRSGIANTLRLLNLPEDVQDNVSRGTLSMGHARALLALNNPEQQIEAAELVVKRGLSVRQTEELVRRLVAREKSAAQEVAAMALDPILQDIEDRLRRTLGTRVRISPGEKRGKIVIDYYSKDDLERILSILMPS